MHGVGRGQVHCGARNVVVYGVGRGNVYSFEIMGVRWRTSVVECPKRVSTQSYGGRNGGGKGQTAFTNLFKRFKKHLTERFGHVDSRKGA
jgi:hypothetical protein